MKNDKFDLVAGDREHRNFGLFDPFFEDLFDMPMFDRKEWRRFNSLMKTDVKETKDKYIIDVEMPGVEKDEITLDLSDGYLTICAKREQKLNEEDKKENFIRRERSFGQMKRPFYVGDVKKEDIDAHLEKGVLQIVLPKKKEENKRNNRIEIK